MTLSGPLTSRFVHAFNAGVAALMRVPVVGGVVGRGLVLLTYTGRRSGRTFTIPVGYRRTGDEIRIGAEFPDAKLWWRNFLGVGRPLSLHLDGVDRPGHGVARRDDQGRVTVTVHLEPA